MLLLCLYIGSLSYDISTVYDIEEGDTICCSFSDSLSSMEIVNTSSIFNNYVTISPLYKDKRILIDILKENNIESQITDNASAFHVLPSFRRKHKISTQELYFLHGRSVQKYVTSKTYCSDTTSKCLLTRPFIPNFIIAIVIFSSVYYLVYHKYKIHPKFWFFDDVMSVRNNVEEIPQIWTRVQFKALQKAEDLHLTKSLIVCIKRDFPANRFTKVTVVPLDNGGYVSFFWEETFPKQAQPQIKVEFQSDSGLKATNITSTVSTYRYYRPLRIKVELNSSTDCLVEIPSNVLTIFLPDGMRRTLINTFLKDCNIILNKLPVVESSFEGLLTTYCKSLGFPRAMVLTDEGEIIFQYCSGTPIGAAEARRIVRKLRKDVEYTAQVFGDCDSTYLRRNDKEVIAIGFNDVHLPYRQDCIPMLAMCVIFIRQMTITSQQLAKYDRLTEIMEKSKTFKYVEYAPDKEKVITRRPPGAEVPEEALQSAAAVPLNTIERGFAEYGGRTYSEIKSRTTSREYGEIVSYFCEDITAVNEQIGRVRDGLAEMCDSLHALGMHRLIMKPKPHLIEGDRLLLQLGYPPSNPLMSVVHPDDIIRFASLGQRFQVDVPPDTTRFDDLATAHVYNLDGLERRFTIPQSEKDYFEKFPNDKKVPNLKAGESTFVRLIAKGGKIHFYGVVANASIGFMYPMDAAALAIFEQNTAFKFTTAKIRSTFWAVDMGSDSVFNLFGLPTVWQMIGVDNLTLFPSFANFLQGGTDALFAQAYQDMKDRKETAWTGEVLLKQVSGRPKWFKLAFFAQDSLLICSLTNIKEIKYVESSLEEYTTKVQTIVQLSNISLFSFYDTDMTTCEFPVYLEGADYHIISWQRLDCIAPEYQHAFAKKMRAALDLGHYFEMYLKIALREGEEMRWAVMIGKRHDRSNVIHGIIVPTDEIMKGLVPSSERDIIELSDITRQLLTEARSAGGRTPEMRRATEKVEAAVRSLLELTMSGSDMSSDY